MELNLLTATGASADTLTVSDEAFGREYNEALVHQVVTAYLAGGRAGTRAQKSRSDVRGSGAKPWRQKGTGRARAGTKKSPLWRSGGVTFAATPQDHSQKVNKKMYRGALRAILSELVRQSRLKVVDAFDIDEPKTKKLVEQLKTIEAPEVLIVTDNVSNNLYLAARNLHRVTVIDVHAMDPVSLISHKQVLMTVAAVKQLEELLK